MEFARFEGFVTNRVGLGFTLLGLGAAPAFQLASPLFLRDDRASKNESKGEERSIKMFTERFYAFR